MIDGMRKSFLSHLDLSIHACVRLKNNDDVLDVELMTNEAAMMIDA
jgi:hypothetical protein